MKILIIGDTHGMDDLFATVKRAEAPFEMLLHLGDVEGEKRVYEEKCGSAQVLFVKGNCDDHSDDPLDRIINIDGSRIYMAHGHYLNVDGTEESLHVLCDMAIKKKADIVAFGHTHVPLIKIRDGVLLLNPGSLAFNAMGMPPSYITLEIHKGLPAEAEIHFVEKDGWGHSSSY